jgi:predicted permease
MGIAVAYWGKELFRLLPRLGPELDLRIDAGVLGFAAVVSILTAFLYGLIPAFRSTRAPVQSAAGRFSRGSSRLSRTLLVAQLAMSVVLLAGAGLFIRTLGNWKQLDPGFKTENLLTFQVNPDALHYDDVQTDLLRERLLDRIDAAPGVVAATTSTTLWDYWIFGMSLANGERSFGVRVMPVRHDFFETLGLQIRAGRGLEPAENSRAARVAVVDETLARRLFQDSNPVGRRFRFSVGPAAGSNEMEIVGVVNDMIIPGRVTGGRTDDFLPTVYLPQGFRPGDHFPELGQTLPSFPINFEIRTAANPMALLPTIREAVAEIEPDLPLVDPKTMVQGMEERLEPTRLLSWIWISFGGLALLLSSIGLYGLMAYSVEQRTREVGIRTALGAQRRDVMQLILGQGLFLVLVGLVAGLAASLAANQLIRSIIFGVTLYDPTTIAGVAVVLFSVTGIAAYLPARRAARVDPTIALRCE